MDRLMEAASTLLGQAGGAAEWAGYAGPAPAVLTAEYQQAAQRATRCLALMQTLVEDCQVSKLFCRRMRICMPRGGGV